MLLNRLHMQFAVVGILGLLLFGASSLLHPSHVLPQGRSQGPNGAAPRVISADASQSALHRMAVLLNRTIDGSAPPACQLETSGSGWGAHQTCRLAGGRRNQCAVVSYGINLDFSFDRAMMERDGCSILMFDPAFSYPTNIMNNSRATFFQLGARLLDVKPRYPNPATHNWITPSVPLLMRAFGVDQIDILKMDCEGCEYGLADDVLAHDPEFFKRVGQFAVEVHISKFWIKRDAHMQAFGNLMVLLEEAGLLPQHGSLSGCGKDKEDFGCPQGLLDAGWPCERRLMCQNVLFARATQ